MWLLYEDLARFIDEKFLGRQINFEPGERIVFWINDLDYFINDDFPGFSLYNLQLILRELDIPNFFCAVVSNIPNYDRYTKKIRDILRPDDVPLRAITMSPVIEFMPKLLESKEISIEKIEYPFIVMSRLSRFHRSVFMAKLFESNLQSGGMVSYHNINSSNDLISPDKIYPLPTGHSNHPTFLTTSPFTLYNTENIIKIPKNIKLVNDFKSKVSRYCNFDEDTDITDKIISSGLQNDPIQRALVYIALETTVKYPAPFQSNISFKSISQKRPLIIFGAAGCIKLLKDQGFQTFNQWWDEDYDNEPDIEKRVDMIIEIVKYLASLDLEKSKVMCQEMKSLLDYNYQHFISAFPLNELSKKDKLLNQSMVDYD